MLEPILHPKNGGRGTGDEGRGLDEGADPDDDLSPRAVALRALKEIEFDRATGKLSDADYETLQAKYMAEALAALRREERSGKREAELPAPTKSTLPSSDVPRRSCPTHGPRPESDAQFCSECGSRLGSAPGYCSRCGTSLERDARYCHSCGARVAA